MQVTEVALWWVVASVGVGIGSVLIGYLLVLLVEYVQELFRPANGEDPVEIQCTHASTALVPLISGLRKCGIPFDGSELWILGCDGRYIVNKKRGLWRNAFGDWIQDGLKIKFILLEADDDVRKELCKLKREFGDSFDATVLNSGAIPEVARELDTFHPTLFLAKDNNAVWIEGLHHRNSISAYDVEYISPKAMRKWPEKGKLFQSCKNRLDLVLENSTSLLGEAA